MYVNSLPRTSAGKIDFKLVEEYDTLNYQSVMKIQKCKKRIMG